MGFLSTSTNIRLELSILVLTLQFVRVSMKFYLLVKGILKANNDSRTVPVPVIFRLDKDGTSTLQPNLTRFQSGNL